MAKKKNASASRAADKELIAKLTKARAKREEAEASAQKWKKRAQARRKDVKRLQAELDDVRRQLATAEASVRGAAGATTTAPAKKAPARKAPARKAPAKKSPAKKAPVTRAGTRSRGQAARADDSWTLTALRAEARSRGLAGYSRKSKAQLLAALRG